MSFESNVQIQDLLWREAKIPGLVYDSEYSCFFVYANERKLLERAQEWLRLRAIEELAKAHGLVNA